MENKEALNAIEVAELLNITKNTVYELVKRGELPAYKVGKKLRIDKSDVKEYIDNQKHKKTLSKSNLNKIHEVKSDYNDDSIVLTGQDIILDILANLIQGEGYRVLRSNMGSYMGLLSLYMGEVTLCTSHMWDGHSDTYNEPYVRSLVPGTSCVIINLAYRIQGFYVKKGNPKKIAKWEDIAKDGVRLINRERGAGTRVLLDEKMKKSPLLLNILKKNPYKGGVLPPESSDFVSDDNLFNYQAKVIKDLAAQESCIIIGRCADYVLKDNPDVIRLFFYAPLEDCIRRVVDQNGISAKEAEKKIAKIDKYRADYYKYYTGHAWNDARNYDFCLDTSSMSYEKLVAVVKDIIKIYQE